MENNVENIILECKGVPVYAQYRPGTGSEIVVFFHGSLDRKKRDIPFYYQTFSDLGTAHQISIFDPAIERYAKLTSCWYLGWEGAPLWEALSSEIIAFGHEKGCDHRTYVGGSSGGFAALLYSHLDKGSTAIAINAQTNVLRHVYGRVARNYLQTAWPKLTKDEWPLMLPLKLAPLLSENNDNTIIYLQCNSDYLHLANHALPFLNALPPESFDRHVVNIDFDGIHGHGASIRRPTIRHWILASFAARGVIDRPFAAIVDAKRDMDMQDITQPAQITNRSSSFQPSDLRTADRLAQWHISESQS